MPMRDMYSRLGLGFGADEKALKMAVERCADAELKRRAAEVLLNAERRAAHDSVYRVARQLRDWRLELHLEDGAWAKALADSDLVRPNLPETPLSASASESKKAAWWQRLLGRA